MAHIVVRLPSPLGDMIAITGSDGAVCALDFADCAARLHRLFARHHAGATLAEAAAPPALAAAFTAYFAGHLAALNNLAIAVRGTPFQHRAWAALRTIAPGETRSYAAQAAAIGQPCAARAVGLANSANPIALIIPCHRVIGTSGALAGYAGGVARKAWLLAHEGALPPQPRLPF